MISDYYHLLLFMGRVRARARPHPMCWALSEDPSADGHPGPSDGRHPGPSDGRPRGPGPRPLGRTAPGARARARVRSMNNNK